jgi:hypothetical protein
MKMVRTRYDLIDAITKAVVIVKAPKFIPATATVTAVKVKSPSHTRI